MPIDSPDIIQQFVIFDRRISRLERSVMSYVEAPEAEVVANYEISGIAITTQTVQIDGSAVNVYLRLTWSVPLEPDSDPVRIFHIQHSFDGGTTWSQITTIDGPPVEYGPFPPGKSISIRVRAVSARGVLGAWATVSTTTTADSVSPNQPSTPTVDAYLGTLVIGWNGLDVFGDPMPEDFKFAEIHISEEGPLFICDDTNLVGVFLHKGSFVLGDLVYNTTYYIRLVASDWNYNKSPASTAASGVPLQIVNTDLIDDIVTERLLADDAVTEAAIADLAVGTANIQNLAVVDAKIGSVSANKIVTGLIQASQAIMIGSLTGRRVEINAQAVTSYDVIPEVLSQTDMLGSLTPLSDVSDWSSVTGIVAGVSWAGSQPTPTTTTKTASGVSYSGVLLSWDDTPSVDGDSACYLLNTTYTVSAGSTVEIAISAIADYDTSPWRICMFSDSTDFYVESEWRNPNENVQTAVLTQLFTSLVTDLRIGIAIDKPAEGWSALSGDTCFVMQVDVDKTTYGSVEREIPIWQLGTGTNDNFFAVNRPGHADEILAAISAQGDISGRDITASRDFHVGEDLYIGSEHIDEYLDHRARGIVEWANVQTDWQFGGGEMMHYEIAADLVAGRMYKLSAYARLDDVAITDNDPVVRIRYTTDGSQPGLSTSTVLATTRVPMGSKLNNVVGSFSIIRIYYPNVDQRFRCVFTYDTESGGPAKILDAQYILEDVGPYIPTRAVARQDAYVSPSDPTPTDQGSGSNSEKEYTKTWTASWSASYEDRNGYISYYGSQVRQGYFSSTWGIQAALVGFDLGSTLTGATIKKVEIYLYASHWYYNSGGTAVIRTHGLSSRPSTFSSESGAKKVAFKVGQGKWVNITSIFENNDRGIALDPGNTTNREYYGRFHGAKESNKPKLRITYTK